MNSLITTIICLLGLSALATAEEPTRKPIHSCNVSGTIINSFMDYGLIDAEAVTPDELTESLDCRLPINAAKRFFQQHQLQDKVRLTEVKLRRLPKGEKTYWCWQLFYFYEGGEAVSGTGAVHRLPLQVTLDGKVMAEAQKKK